MGTKLDGIGTRVDHIEGMVGRKGSEGDRIKRRVDRI